MHETIVFIDEDNAFLPTKEFAEAVRKSDNYYVIVTREGLPNLPYSVEEICGIRESGKYAVLKQTYNELFHIYGKTDYTKPVKPGYVMNCGDVSVNHTDHRLSVVCNTQISRWKFS